MNSPQKRFLNKGGCKIKDQRIQKNKPKKAFGVNGLLAVAGFFGFADF
ncbi:MAG: hypothetical protein V1777_05045 [Candidatus Micrarchaeota archaeon]